MPAVKCLHCDVKNEYRWTKGKAPSMRFIRAPTNKHQLVRAAAHHRLEWPQHAQAARRTMVSRRDGGLVPELHVIQPRV
jgi:hypothetical protein